VKTGDYSLALELDEKGFAELGLNHEKAWAKQYSRNFKKYI
jgi:hypothetical protein